MAIGTPWETSAEGRDCFPFGDFLVFRWTVNWVDPSTRLRKSSECRPPGLTRAIFEYKLAKKLDFSLKTFGFSLKPFRRSLKSWRGPRRSAAGDGEGPPGPPLPKGDPQQPPHGMAHFEGGTSTSCDDRDFAAIPPGLRVSFFRGAAAQRGVAPSSCGVSTGSPPRRRGPKLRPLLWRSQ